LVESELQSLEQEIVDDRKMYSTFTRLQILDTDFGRAIDALLRFDRAKRENLRFHWDRYALCYKTLHRLHLTVLHVLSVPAALVAAFALLLALADTFLSRGALGWATSFALAAAVLGLVHTVYTAVRTVQRTHWVTVQREHEEQDKFEQERKEYTERMRGRLQEQLAAQHPPHEHDKSADTEGK
jgi:hypothetical protein